MQVRLALATALACLVSACAQIGGVLGGREETNAQQAPASAPENAPTSLEGLCAALLPDASLEELRAVLGDGVSYDNETSDLYINPGTSRALYYASNGDRSLSQRGFDFGAVGEWSSGWTLHGLRIGDSVDAGERANGRPFLRSDDGIDWGGGALAGDACDYAVTFDSDAEGFDWTRSDDPAVRARAPKISGLYLRWRREGYTIPHPPLAPPVPVDTRRSFTEVCDLLREDMSPAELRRAFGARNVRELPQDDSFSLSVAVYPNDPQRIFRVNFAGGGEYPWRIYYVEIDSPVSTWALPNGLGMGDRLDAVERGADGPFDVQQQDNNTARGPDWNHNGAGSLGACSYHVSLDHDRALFDTPVNNSADPAFRSWRPRLSRVRVDWRWF
ncbi:hypothetical protein U91I_00598 [alpha proteobacterium U9-1i]|nr:hypothetical protein U91I_00598 [alpha proteobacterium U9-1i]